MTYKIGDRVVAVCDIGDTYHTHGKAGHIITYNFNSDKYGVEFDTPIKHANWCGGAGAKGHCLWCYGYELRPERFTPDTCVACGEPIPEGRQICWGCEHQYET